MVWGRSLFGSNAPRGGPSGHRAYAVGDVHGRLDLLEALLGQIEADDRARDSRKTVIIFLGDLIDRGPDSAGVVERLRTYRPGAAKLVFLMGNHEEIMLRIVKGEMTLLPDWLRFGGAECLQSYGVDPEELRRLPRQAAQKAIVSSIPEEHVSFLSSFVDSASFGRFRSTFTFQAARNSARRSAFEPGDSGPALDPPAVPSRRKRSRSDRRSRPHDQRGGRASAEPHLH